jgi:hypothetical protein
VAKIRADIADANKPVDSELARACRLSIAQLNKKSQAQIFHINSVRSLNGYEQR